MVDVDVENFTLPHIFNVTEEEELSDVELEIRSIKENIDGFFLIIISFIVFFLQGGFAFLEAGSVRSKNATNILIKNMLDVFIAGISFWLVGYPLAFGEGNAFLGYTYWAGYGLETSKIAHWCFQFVFAATAATIVSGSVAERCAFNAYFIYSVMLTAFVYPIIAHWAWHESGWLAGTSYHDFAGSGVVHLTGGISAFFGALMLGPRIGRFQEGKPDIRGHSLPLAGLGGFILLFGFLAFNGGSQGSISNPGDSEVVARAVINTIISGSSGGLCVLVISRLRGTYTWSFLLTLNGALTGMVSICSGCDVHTTWGAMCTGIIGGFVFLAIHHLLVKLKVDDPLDAVAVHMGGGIWGLIATPIFMEGGLVHGHVQQGVSVLGWNLIGMLSILAWAGGICFVMFGSLRLLKMLRVPEQVERKGLDILKHGEPAYPVEAWYEEQYYSNKVGGKFDRRSTKVLMNTTAPPDPNNPHGMGAPQGRFGPPNMGGTSVGQVPTRERRGRQYYNNQAFEMEQGGQ